jgi:hypothetical protein
MTVEEGLAALRAAHVKSPRRREEIWRGILEAIRQSGYEEATFQFRNARQLYCMRLRKEGPRGPYRARNEPAGHEDRRAGAGLGRA